MNEIAKASSLTPLTRIQSTTCLSKVGNWREFAVYRARSVPTAVESVTGSLSRVFVLESRINIADQVVIVVVANNNLFDFSVLAHFAPEILIKGVEMILKLGWVHLVLGVVGRILVEVGKEDGLAVAGLDMFS